MQQFSPNPKWFGADFHVRLLLSLLTWEKGDHEVVDEGMSCLDCHRELMFC